MPDEQKRIEKLFKEGKASLTVPEKAAESIKDILPSNSLFLGYCLHDDGAFPWCVWVFYLQEKKLVGAYAQGGCNEKAGMVKIYEKDCCSFDELNLEKIDQFAQAGFRLQVKTRFVTQFQGLKQNEDELNARLKELNEVRARMMERENEPKKQTDKIPTR